jgi:hypothetical protein
VSHVKRKECTVQPHRSGGGRGVAARQSAVVRGSRPRRGEVRRRGRRVGVREPRRRNHQHRGGGGGAACRVRWHFYGTLALQLKTLIYDEHS